MPLFLIENMDDCGEGMFIVDAASKKDALRMHNKMERHAKVTDISKVKWVSLALVTGERGECYYKERMRYKVK